MKKKQNKVNMVKSSGRRLFALCFAASMLCHGLPVYADEPPNRGGHVHTESCYRAQKRLICELEENLGHQHMETCWELVRGDLICTDNSDEHVHSDECYEWSWELTCGLEDGEGAHAHDEDCYEDEIILICDEEETPPEPESEEPEPEPDEGEEPESEPEEEDELIGPGDEHVSYLPYERELCFADVSDPTADLEDQITWWRMFSDMELSGNWAEDLLMVAESQLGYTESELNYVAEDPWHPKGYTRYGAWFGLPYGDWCAMFISFCMYYAEIPSSAVPYNCHCSEWARDLAVQGLYRSWDEGYEPKPGDFVFFDFDMDEKPEHAGIIRKVDEERGWIYTIEGNRYDYVEHFVLTKNDYAIIGYGELPENPNYDPYRPVVRQNGRVELPPDPVEPTPPSWDTLLEAAAGIKTVDITPSIEASRVSY